jgi:hypothetical protein
MHLTLLDALVFFALFLLIIGAAAASAWADRYLESTIAAALDYNPFDPMDGDPMARAEEILADHDRLMDWATEHWWDG